MTHPAHPFSTTQVLASFWLAIRYQQRFWSWMFFAGCGLGLLAKGPVALVISGMPVFFWTLWRKEWGNLWRRLPWFGGSLLALAIAVPWYALAQIRAPEFLSYFLIGEHIHKFLEPGWNGDRYGFAHAFPHGTIWIFALLCFLPWSATVPALTGKAKEAVWKDDDDGWMLFLALWSLASLVFFTLAANIIWTYPLPALPGIALLFTEIMLRLDRRIPIAVVYGTVLAGAAATLVALVMPNRFDYSERDMIAAWRRQAPALESRLLYWGYKRIEFSAAFYSSGRATTTSDSAAAEALLKNGTRDYIVSTPGGLERLPRLVREGFEDIGHYENGRGVRILLRENARSTAGP
jgi:4-amino-4-deoxy-L-arabinose transferase-like glycosyltransferase